VNFLTRLIWGTRGGWRRLLRVTLVLLLTAALTYGTLFAISWSRLQHIFAANNAAMLCAGIFISGRSAEEVDRQSIIKEGFRKRIYDAFSVNIDRQNGTVTVGGSLIAPIVASYQGERGCILSQKAFPPVKLPVLQPKRFDSFTVITRAELPDEAANKLDAEVARNFADPTHATHALLIYKNNILLREAYAAGGGPDYLAENWSFGKTLVGTLVGRLIAEGKLSLDEPIAIQQWPAGNPRRGIRVRDAMGMAGGLRFTTGYKTFPLFVQADHGLVYTDLEDAVRFVVDRPLQHKPSTAGSYNNADPLLLLEFIRQKLNLSNDGLRELIREKVFAPVGMNVAVSTDPKGFPIITGYVFGTARSWGNLGLLYANKGRLNGQQYLAEGFVDFVGTPSPGYPGEAYGGMVWLNRHGFYKFPKEALVISGAGDQIVMILPADGIVIVRLGHRNKSATTRQTFDDSFKNIVEILKSY